MTPRLLLALVLAAAAPLAACGGEGSAVAPTSDTDAAAPAEQDVAGGAADAEPPEADGLTDADAAEDAGPVVDPTPLADLVNPFVGTGAELINFGALFPGATTPFGMVRLSPDTEDADGQAFGVAHAGGYFHGDPLVTGFSHIHLVGTGVADYGNLLVVPADGDPAALLSADDQPTLALDHELEHAEPGYYRLDSVAPAVLSELTATPRAGLHRYTFATDAADPLLVLDVTHTLGTGEATESAVSLDAASGEITGFVHNLGDFSSRFDGFDLHFVIAPDPPPDAWGAFDSDGYHAGATSAEGTRSGLALRYEATPGAPTEVVLRVGISFVDVDGARANLEAEATARTFDEVRAAARETWEEALGVVEVEGGTDSRRRILYTALYHAQLMPTLLTDVDGRYRGLDKEVHDTGGAFTYYSDFSLWDTYRTFHPLANLLFPGPQRDFLRSLEAMAVEGGSMPVWPLAIGDTGSMIGTSADVVFADAYAKGFEDFDVETAYQALRALATGPPPPGNSGRDGLERCLEVGWCPADEMSGSVSKTLEYATDDYCLARFAADLGHADDAAMFGERAGAWEHLWDGTFLAPRNADGSFGWYSEWSRSDAYVEGTPWQYLFMVPHDAAGLAAVMGGADAFVERLSAFMQGGRDDFSSIIPSNYYWHGNEPTILSPWLFGYGGRSDLTREWTTWVADAAYTLEPHGLAGNDDGGTLSSWYVFAAAGLYPLPCTDDYLLSAPLFDRVVWHLEGGDLDVRLGADPAGPVLLDGAEHDDFRVSWPAIAGGVALELPPAAGE